MSFLRKIFFKDDTVETKDTVPEPGKTVSSDHQEITPQNVPENIVFTPTPVNLMSRLFRIHNTALSEIPETLYENEAWAPVNEFVGLFRKHRVNTEEQTGSSSDFQ